MREGVTAAARRHPVAHIDMCGPMQSDKDDSWCAKGPSGFRARLLGELALAFRPPRKA